MAFSVLICALGFVLILGTLVALHEWGHYYAARRVGIHPTAFSLGFGPTLWSRVDRHGTAWRVAMLPLGGSVQFLGDKNGSSAAPDAETVAQAAGMTPEERRLRFHLRGPGSRAIVIAAGPAVNLALGLAVMAGVLVFNGKQVTPPVVAEVSAGSPAQVAGIMAGDRFVSIDGTPVTDFSDIFKRVSLYPGRTMHVAVDREGARREFDVVPERAEIEAYGVRQGVGRIGVVSGRAEMVKVSPAEALQEGFSYAMTLTKGMFVAIGQIATGDRPISDMGGPVKMAQMSGSALQLGIVPTLILFATLSINLGLFNLLPFPVLDGGGLIVCALEAAMRRPVPARWLNYAQNAGAVALIALMVVVTASDLDLIGLLRNARG